MWKPVCLYTVSGRGILCFMVGFLLFYVFAQIGDQFMQLIEPVAAYLPYMTAPGNHGKLLHISILIYILIHCCEH